MTGIWKSGESVDAAVEGDSVEIFLERTRFCSAENPFSGVQSDIDNFIANAGVPLFAKPFDLGQLGHRADYATELYCRCW